MYKPVFFKTDGVPQAGLTPTVYAARNLATGADVSSSVSVSTLALGVYAVSYAGTAATAGTIYAGVDTVDNPYVDFVFTSSEINANISVIQTADSNTILTNLQNALIAASSSVNDVGATTTSFVTALSSSVNNFYKGQAVVFTSGVLVGQLGQIASYNGSTKAVTLQSALTSAPANGVTFQIVNVAASRKLADFIAAISANDSKPLISTDAQTLTAKIDLIDAPNGTAVTAIQNGLSKPGTAQTIAANQSVNVAQWGGSNISSPTVAGQPVVTLGATQAAYAPAKVTDVEDAVLDAKTADHTGAGTIGKAIGAAGGAADPWGTEVPGEYPAGTAGYQIGRIGTTEGDLTQPILVNASLEITIIRGDDYLNTDSRALDFTFTGIPNLVNKKVYFKAQTYPVFEKEMTVVSSGSGTQTVRLELLTAETSIMPIGDTVYDIEVINAEGHIDTIVNKISMTILSDVR